MSQVATIRESWFRSPWLYERLLFTDTGDAIVLLEDAVLALHTPLPLSSFLAKCEARGVCVFAMAEDCRMRGIENQQPAVQLIEDAEFVDLIVEHDKQVAW